MNITARFTDEMVSLANSYCDDPDEAAAASRGSSFAECAMIILHRLRIFLEETYEMIIDRLEVMPPILEIVGVDPDDLHGQRAMTETANFSVKLSYGSAVRAREWYGEFREIILMCTVYNIKRYVTA